VKVYVIGGRGRVLVRAQQVGIYTSMWRVFRALTFVGQCGKSKWKNKCTIWHLRLVHSSVAMWLKAFSLALFVISDF